MMIGYNGFYGAAAADAAALDDGGLWPLLKAGLGRGARGCLAARCSSLWLTPVPGST